MAEAKKKLSMPRMILLAVLAGAFAGAVAVYVSGGLEGNTGLAQAGADAACAARGEAAKKLAAAATGAVAAMQPADPPQSLASLSYNGPDGQPTGIAAQQGRTILLNLWATWCVPCRTEMPALDALEKSWGSEQFEVVAVNVDTGDDSKPRKFLEETGITALAHYRENTLGLFNDLKKRGLALGLPVTLLIDNEGCLVASMNGPADWASPDADRFIETALSGGV